MFYLDAMRQVIDVYNMNWKNYLRQRVADEERRKKERANIEKKATALQLQAARFGAKASGVSGDEFKKCVLMRFTVSCRSAVTPPVESRKRIAPMKLRALWCASANCTCAWPAQSLACSATRNASSERA